MRIDGEIVEEEVGQAVPRQVPGYVHLRREHETGRIDAAGTRFVAKVAHCRLAPRQQPQYAAFDLAQQPHPDVEEWRGEFVAVVETAEHESACRQADGVARWDLGPDPTLG